MAGGEGAECAAALLPGTVQDHRGSDPGHTPPGIVYAAECGQPPGGSAVLMGQGVTVGQGKASSPAESTWGDRKLPSTGGVWRLRMPESRRCQKGPEGAEVRRQDTKDHKPR